MKPELISKIFEQIFINISETLQVINVILYDYSTYLPIAKWMALQRSGSIVMPLDS